MKKKRYTLPEEQPIPVGWHPANEEEAVTRIEAIERNTRMGYILMLKNLKKN